MTRIPYDTIARSLAEQAALAPKSVQGQNNIVIGKRVQLPTNPAGTAIDITDASGWRDLVRGYYQGGTLWQVTLAPVEQIRDNPAATLPFTGNPLLRMQFGGGGVATELFFNWPLLGASFVIPAEQVTLDVRGTDAAVFLAGASSPFVAAWLLKDAKPTFPASLFGNGVRNSPAVTSSLLPFCRRLHIGYSDPATTVRVELFNFAGAVVYSCDVDGDTAFTVPVPSDAQRFTVTGTAPAQVSVVQELSFT